MPLFVTRRHAVAIGVGQEDLIDLQVLAVHPNAVQRIAGFRIDRYLAGERLLRGIDSELETIMDRYDRVAQAAHRHVGLERRTLVGHHGPIVQRGIGLRASGDQDQREYAGQYFLHLCCFHYYSLSARTRTLPSLRVDRTFDIRCGFQMRRFIVMNQERSRFRQG